MAPSSAQERQNGVMLHLRAYRPADRDAVYDICVRTADAGGDARGHYSSDRLMGDIYAAPYVEYAPELATMVTLGEGDDAEVVGYLVGVADTADYVRWYRENWLPGFVERYPLTETDAAANTDAAAEAQPSTVDLGAIKAGMRPEGMLIAELAEYPAHLHIDLLPAAQGQGLGRTLITSFRTQLRELGVPGVHLGYAQRNESAGAFYERLGFHPLPSSTPEGPLVGISTAE